MRSAGSARSAEGADFFWGRGLEDSPGLFGFGWLVSCVLCYFGAVLLVEEPVQAPHEPIKMLQAPVKAEPAQLEQTTEALQPAKAPQDEAKLLHTARGLATTALKNEAKKKTQDPESCTPMPMPVGFEAAVGNSNQSFKIRLQCWDCPGQQEYALLNLLYFAQGIYVVVCDMSEDQSIPVEAFGSCHALFYQTTT